MRGYTSPNPTTRTSVLSRFTAPVNSFSDTIPLLSRSSMLKYALTTCTSNSHEMGVGGLAYSPWYRHSPQAIKCIFLGARTPISDSFPTHYRHYLVYLIQQNMQKSCSKNKPMPHANHAQDAPHDPPKIMLHTGPGASIIFSLSVSEPACRNTPRGTAIRERGSQCSAGLLVPSSRNSLHTVIVG